MKSLSIKTLYVACDHAGVALKEKLKSLLPDLPWKDLGTSSTNSVDYPDYANQLAETVVREKTLGLLICGSGIGMSIAANRHPGVRAAVVESEITARLSREHNHSNILCIGARILAPEYAAEILKAWLTTEPSQNPRHLARLQKIEKNK